MHSGPQARTRIVQSPANRWVKALRRALTHPPALAEAGAPLALEGTHLLSEAIASKLIPSAVFVCEGFALGQELPPETELLMLPPVLFRATVSTEAPQPVAALLPAPVHSFADAQTPLLLVLARLQDPGNVGTLLRSAEAFGATGAVLLSGTATPWSGKALRASAGSALRLPLHGAPNAEEAAALLRARGIRSHAAVPRGGGLPSLRGPSAIWIGNEGAGLSPAELAVCDERITLPMSGRAESLNAAVAGSLLLYEAARSRA